MEAVRSRRRAAWHRAVGWTLAAAAAVGSAAAFAWEGTGGRAFFSAEAQPAMQNAKQRAIAGQRRLRLHRDPGQPPSGSICFMRPHNPFHIVCKAYVYASRMQNAYDCKLIKNW